MYNPSLAYEYAFDAIEDVESNQCVSCKFAEIDEAVPTYMCWDAQGNIMFEKPVEFMDELANGRVVCRRYEAISS